MKAAIYLLLFFSLTASLANATITLTRVGDVSIYQNNQGKYYISDACHTTGNSMDPNTTIGPGYIYRVDLNGKEVVAPLPSGKTIPPTGLGIFVADMYEGDPNNTGNGYVKPQRQSPTSQSFVASEHSAQGTIKCYQHQRYDDDCQKSMRGEQAEVKAADGSVAGEVGDAVMSVIPEIADQKYG